MICSRSVTKIGTPKDGVFISRHKNLPESCLHLLVILPGMSGFAWAGAGDLYYLLNGYFGIILNPKFTCSK